VGGKILINFASAVDRERHEGSGTNLNLARYSDTGSFLADTLTIRRSHGAILLNELTASLPLKLNGSKIVTSAAIDVSGAEVAGTLAAARFPSLTGDVATVAGALATTLASAGTAGTYTKVTTDAKGRITAGAALAATDMPNHAEVSLRAQGAAIGATSLRPVRWIA
jgi:hypothetical protein